MEIKTIQIYRGEKMVKINDRDYSFLGVIGTNEAIKNLIDKFKIHCKTDLYKFANKRLRKRIKELKTKNKEMEEILDNAENEALEYSEW